MCIEKSLLLFRFAPYGAPCQDSDSSKAVEGSSAPLLCSSSVSESDFQASCSQQTGSEECNKPRPGQGQAQTLSCGHSVQGRRGSTESLPSSGAAEAASPSALHQKAPFSRARLRLLSCRSTEEPRMTPSVKERYPILKHILNFIKDQTLTTARCNSNSLVNLNLLLFAAHSETPTTLYFFP